jgi:hypothetical protein
VILKTGKDFGDRKGFWRLEIGTCKFLESFQVCNMFLLTY